MALDHQGLELTFLTGAADSDGEVCRVEIRVPPGSGALRHVHPRQEERILIREGRLTIGVGRKTGVYGPGETIVAPVGTAHWVSSKSKGWCESSRRFGRLSTPRLFGKRWPPSIEMAGWQEPDPEATSNRGDDA
jgi:hypothetical protein